MISAAEIARMLVLPDPTPEQVAVIEAPLEPVLVVAGAGSGKTETMSARVVFLIANELVEPDRVLGLTFTRKAAGELSDRVRRRLRALGAVRGGRRALVSPTVSTYNAYAAGLVGEHALRLGVEPSARLLSEAGRWQLAHDVVEHWSEDLGVDLAASTVTEAVLDLAGAVAEHLVEPDEVRRHLAGLVEAIEAMPPGERPGMPGAVVKVRDSLRLRGALMDLVDEFTARKRRADLVDFADQVALAARLAREVPQVAALERSRYEVVLLDEYQDTSVAQLELLRHLFGGGHPVTAVGDPHQSVYGWRGASAGGLQRFPHQFPVRTPRGTTPARTLALSTSWRNDTAVLAVANTVVAPLRAAWEKPLGARPTAGPGEVAAALLTSAEEEARVVADFVATRRRDGSTAAVLCRKRAQFPLLHAALLDAGLPVEVVGLGGLLSTPEVVDLVAALEAAHDPSRGDSLMRLLTGPRARLGLADLHALAEWSRPEEERGIIDALDDLPPAGWRSRNGRRLSETGRERLADLAGVLRAVRAQTYLPVVDLVAEAERLLGLDIEVAARPGRSPAAARAHLDAFRSVAAGFTDDDDVGTLGAFLAWLDAAREEERGLDIPLAEMDPEAVQLLTVHAAKGLEWDVVAVPGLVEGTFPLACRGGGWVRERGWLPTSLRGDRDSLPDVDLAAAEDLTDLSRRLERYGDDHAAHHLAEERRLAYVALTRARTHLMLAASWWRDGVKPVRPSIFLTDLVQDGLVSVLEWADEPTGARPERSESAAVWPGEQPLGSDRLERAAAAVRAADPGAAGGELGPVVELLLEERRRSRADRRAVALPAHLSASSLVRLAADPEQFALQLRRPVPLAPSTRARRGTTFHSWVEGYFGVAALVDVDALPGADDDSVSHDSDLAALQGTFLASPWASRTPVAVEVDVETPVADVVVRCRIDAVFAEPDGRVVVVDWKTGRPPKNPATRELQLAVYRLAWSRWKGVPLEDVDAAFVYVATGQTVRAKTELGLEQIAALLATAS